eukprot:354429-Chlamydomonas_euryale.AAC.2
MHENTVWAGWGARNRSAVAWTACAQMHGTVLRMCSQLLSWLLKEAIARHGWKEGWYSQSAPHALMKDGADTLKPATPPHPPPRPSPRLIHLLACMTVPSEVAVLRFE